MDTRAPQPRPRKKSRLERDRDRARLTQMELARLAGVSQSFISRLENGEMNDASFGLLDLVAGVLRRRGCKTQAADIRPRPKPTLVEKAS